MEYGLIGRKLSHSFSKTVHEKLFDYDYELKELETDMLDLFFSAADFKAINVTIPYKQDVIKYMYQTDPIAKRIGAVNTVKKSDGKLYGYNTDYMGMTALIKKSGADLTGKKVLILGTGGTSKTAVAVATDLNASKVLRVSRKPENGDISYSDAVKFHSDADIIINTTPCGMYPNLNKSAVNLDDFKNVSAVFDAIYNPLSPKLIVDARKRGITASGGLYMLISQAVFAAEIFTDSKIPSSQTDRVYNEILKEKQNLVLIGMPGSGKTTVGKEIAKRLNKTFFDTDDEIIKKTGMPITEFFKNYGEKRFREIETETVREISPLQSSVIATGGGVILNGENIDLLKQNGIVVFLDRPLEKLVATDDRPLSSDKEMLKKRYDERYELYKSAADIIINADGDLENEINHLKEVFLLENTCY